jgi:hypothetical protein
MNQNTQADVYFVYGTSKSRVKQASKKESFRETNEYGDIL